METHLWRLADMGKFMRRDRVNQFDILILTRPASVFYFTGARMRGAFAMVTKQGEGALGVPVSDQREARAAAVFDYLRTFDGEQAMIAGIASLIEHFRPEGIKQIGVEYSWLSHGLAGLIASPEVSGEGVGLGDCDLLVDRMRAVKDEKELSHIRGAARVADAGMAAAAAALKPGVTELELAGAAEFAMRREGAEAFLGTGVRSGERTAMAGGRPTMRTIGENELVTVALHPVVEGYSASICRTVCLASAAGDREEAFAVLALAQQETAAMARRGVTLGELEANFFRMLRDAGHEKHVSGQPVHGTGIEVCEAPFAGGRREPAAAEPGVTGAEAVAPPGAGMPAVEETPLKAGTVLAVGSQGLVTGDWGVRVEDTVVVGETGPEVLTSYPRTLAVI